MVVRLGKIARKDTVMAKVLGKPRTCSVCGKPGHNRRKCEANARPSEDADAEYTPAVKDVDEPRDERLHDSTGGVRMPLAKMRKHWNADAADESPEGDEQEYGSDDMLVVEVPAVAAPESAPEAPQKPLEQGQ